MPKRCTVFTCRRVPAFVLLGLCLYGTAVVAAPPEHPKLVLAIVIDQFRYDYLLRFRSDYKAGLARLLNGGAVFTNANYLHAYTVTAVGHSTFLSGATPSSSGIIGNAWFDRQTGLPVTSVSDPSTKLVGGAPGTPGSSPRRLLVSTVGDELKMQGGDSHVIGISIKDRAAILPSGHMADSAYWYDDDSNHWVTSSYYRAELPRWAEEANEKHWYERAVGAQWVPFDALKGAAAKPFCSMVNGGDATFCGSIEATPWGNELIEEFAEAAIKGENLGHHGATDVLTVSFSSNDYVGHRVGPDDPAVRDMAIRTDRLLGKLFDYIQRNIGIDNTLVVLTADHGVAPVPEVNEARHMPGGRLSALTMQTAMSDALTEQFGAGEWFSSNSPNLPYLNQELIRARKLDAAAVEEVAAKAARLQPHIARVYTWQDLDQGRVQRDAIGDAISKSFFAERSADLYILPEPYYLFENSGTSHGTPYDYDTHVPLIFMGKGIKPAVYARKVAVNDVAATLASILEITPPSGSIGSVLDEVIPEAMAQPSAKIHSR